MMPHILVIGTCDTKLHELLYLCSQIIEAGGNVTMIDVGRKAISNKNIDVSVTDLTSKYAPPSSPPNTDLATLSRADVIKHMTLCAIAFIREQHTAGLSDPSRAIHGIIGAGGTGGTALVSAAMRHALPLGFPKLIVSTNASSDVSPIVGETDITLMPSIVDVAGSNELLHRILSNAAGAIVGMARVYEADLQRKRQREEKGEGQRKKRRVGLTMFGVTTPCCDAIRRVLEENHEIETFVFHCTGAGGRALERLVREGGLDAVCDITTTEICDFVAGGVMSAGEDRLKAALEAGIPYVVSLGATDMVNFGPMATVPEKYQKRKLYEHNPNVTLMRTNAEECRAVGSFLVDRIRDCAKDEANVVVVLPKGGVSMIATPDGPFHDSEADAALFETVLNGLKETKVKVVEDERDINDKGFATDVAKELVTLMKL